MIDFLYNLWPYLAGGLIGWLLAGWFAGRLKHSETPVEKIVEKQIDNPQHLSLISKLESENKEIVGLRTKLSGYEAATPKSIDNPVHLKRISELESQVNSLQSLSNNTEQSAVSGSETASVSKKISTPSTSSVSRSSSSKPEAAESPIDKVAAKAAGFRVKAKDGKDDFTVIEGVGPKINELIHDTDIHTYTELGRTKVEKIQEILDAAGSRYKLAKPGTWPAQADMAAANKWEALKAWQDELDGGK